MINYRTIEASVVNGLQTYLTSKNITCAVIRANQTAPVPPYPYISYTITSPVISNTKGYSVASDGKRYKPLAQTWSFTAQSNDDEEAANAALYAYDWFSLAGNTYLSDNNIIVQRVGNIGNRDNLVTIEYEYRRGFDVEFLLSHEISKADCETAGIIETAELSINEEV